MLSARRKEIAAILLSIAIVALVYSMWLFQNQTSDAQKQTVDLQNQLSYYENSTNTLQTHVSNLVAQFHELQNPIYNVTIESVISEPWWNPVGITMLKEFSITVKNIGVDDVGGLTFEFKILADGNVWDSQNYRIVMTAPEQLGVLHVQEYTVIKAEIHSGIGVSFAGKSVVITLMLDETVLDESTVPLSAGYPEA